MFSVIEKILFPHEKRLSLAAAGVLLLASFCLFLPGLFSLPPIDRDEARVALASRQIVDTGNWADTGFPDTRTKPAGIYWLQAGTVKLVQALSTEHASEIIGLYRLPSLLATLLSVLLTGVIGARLFGARAGLIAAVLFSATLLANVQARLAIADAALLPCVLTCVMVLAKTYSRQNSARTLKRKDFLLFWLALGLGLVLKGPAILVVVIGLPLAMRVMGEPLGWLRALRPVLGIPLTLLVMLPWILHAALPLHDIPAHDLLVRLWQEKKSHWAPPGVHTLLSWGALWPASLVIWLALPWLWRMRAEPTLRFLIAWALPVYLLFEILPVKLPQDVLPAAPALALAAAAWLSCREHEGRPHPLWQAVVFILWTALSLVLCLVPAVMPVFVESQIFFFPIFFGGLALGLALATIQLLRRDQRRLVILPLGLSGAALIFALFGFLFIDMPSLFPSARLAEKLAEPPGDCSTTPLFAAGFAEPSLVFLTPPDTKFGRGDDAALALTADPCLTVALDEKQIPSFKETLERVGGHAQKFAEVKGFNYARGAPVTLTLYRTAP